MFSKIEIQCPNNAKNRIEAQKNCIKRQELRKSVYFKEHTLNRYKC